MPIPSYLLAIVVGAVEKRDISERCAVWAESSVVDKAHYEFGEVSSSYIYLGVYQVKGEISKM